ncbi:MAG: hypothetical protein ACR2PL_12610 [Dehalococcoidia bacterium]
MDDLQRLQRGQTDGSQGAGARAFVGAWGDILSDEEIDQMVSDIYAAREPDIPRPVDLEL